MKKGIKKIQGIMALTAVMFLLWVLLVPSVHAAEYFKQAFGRFSAIAGETLATGDVVCISATDGYAYKADADDSTLRIAVGVIRKGASSGSNVEIVFEGILAGQTSATPGRGIFLSTTAGAIATTRPNGWTQNIGWVLPGTAGASTSTTYFIRVAPPASEGVTY